MRPVPVTDRIREAEIERQLKDLEDNSDGADRVGGRMGAMRNAMTEFRRERIQSMEFYREIPVVRTLRTSWEGPNGLVAFIERDELDVPTVVVLRLPSEVR